MRLPLFSLAFIALLLPQTATSEILSATDKVIQTFMELDLDESETVSFEEYETMVKQRLSERFAEMDSNQDNEISEEEYRNFWVTRKSQYYRPRR